MTVKQSHSRQVVLHWENLEWTFTHQLTMVVHIVQDRRFKAVLTQITSFH